MPVANATTSLCPGFDDPVQDAQITFRTILNAMARPGTVVSVGVHLTAPAPLTPAAAALGLILFDLETPLWTDMAPGSAAIDWLRFHCAAPITADPRLCAFALITRPEHMPPLSGFDPGSDSRPERSTTLIIQVPGFDHGERFSLSGPGIESETHVTIAGLCRRFFRERRQIPSFPCGIDMFFCCGGRLAALPRSTQVD
jgi:alpha-D-ribose 1-methylphosphonate 5-triphosphate synthase subunit PhnH